MSFCSTSCLHPAFYAFASLTIKNGHLNHPFSASSCAIRCHDLLHMSNPLGSSLFSRGFYHCSACPGSFLRLANLTLKNGPLNCPFSASNCVIRCHSLLESPSDKGFYHQSLCLSLMAGGCVLQLADFYSSTCIFHFWHRIVSFYANIPLVCTVNCRHRIVSFVATSQTKVFSFNFWHRNVSFFANLPKELVHTNFRHRTLTVVATLLLEASTFDSHCHPTAGSLYLKFLASNCVTRCQFTEGSCDFPFLAWIWVIRCRFSILSCVPCMVRCDFFGLHCLSSTLDWQLSTSNSCA